MRTAGCSTPVAGMLVALAAVLALLGTAARAAAPPDNIVLIYPVAPVPLGDRFQLGFAVSAAVVPGDGESNGVVMVGSDVRSRCPQRGRS